ncbi:MAG TPA: hypothetical protein VJ301_18885 [Propionibacteriaceae bacterium]|nr:hypothetical protein [Propionibacteriaceae bacterium]
MLEALIQLLILLVVLAVIFYIAKLAATHFGVPPIIVQLIGLILGLVFLLAALRAFGPSIGIRVP